MLLAGHPQVHVGVEEGGEGVQPGRLDQLALAGLRRAGRRQLRDLAAAHDHVEAALDAGDRVEHGRFAQDQVGGLPAARVERLGEGHARFPWPIAVGSPDRSSCGAREDGSERFGLAASSS